MNILQTLILSVVEGLTEFLPISSTGHLVLAAKLLAISQNTFTKTFEISIQSGAILAAIILYWKVLAFDRNVLKRIIISFIPTGIVGLIAYKVIKDSFLGNLNLTLASLFVGGIVIILFERYFQKNKGKLKIKDLSLKRSFLLGLIQSISVIPGVSRAAATIIGGEYLGLERKASVEFSFLLAIPTLLAATGYDLIKNIHEFNSSEIGTLAIGFLGSFIAAYLTIKWFLAFVKNSNLTLFGIYRIIVSIVFFLF
ncbi:MAG TPA: undecaprenyl-diphosphate phosphatase [Patescibacteria group bacterium]